MIGYYGEDFVKPELDPGLPIACPYCLAVITKDPTTKEDRSLTVFLTNESKTYFYRAHESCYRKAKPSVVDKLHNDILGGLV